MWIARDTYEEMRDSRIENAAKVELLLRHNTALQVTLDWLRVRLTQLEHERAQLIYNYMGVKLTVPSIEVAPAPGRTPEDVLGQTLSFDDVGDVEAQRLGLGWDLHGNLTAGKT